MKRTIGATAFFALAVTISTHVRADNVPAENVGYGIYTAEYVQRLEQLEAELASLRTGVDQKADGKCADCGVTDCCCGPTWYAYAELPWLQVYDGGIMLAADPVMAPRYEQEPSYRLIGGREFCNGVGARVRYFDFEDTALTLIPGGSTRTGLDVYALDLEFTHRSRTLGFDTMVSGGVRVGGLEQRALLDDGVDLININRDFDGAGLTFGVDFVRSCWWRSLGVYGGFRSSLLYGDTEATVEVNTPAVTIAATDANILNETFAVWEMQLGLEYRYEGCMGSLVGRAGVEAQMWEQPPVLLGLLDDNVGLFGPTFALGIER